MRVPLILSAKEQLLGACYTCVPAACALGLSVLLTNFGLSYSSRADLYGAVASYGLACAAFAGFLYNFAFAWHLVYRYARWTDDGGGSLVHSSSSVSRKIAVRRKLLAAHNVYVGPPHGFVGLTLFIGSGGSFVAEGNAFDRATS
jgi:hypothetical protein